jgi:hypothetical protein
MKLATTIKMKTKYTNSTTKPSQCHQTVRHRSVKVIKLVELCIKTNKNEHIFYRTVHHHQRRSVSSQQSVTHASHAIWYSVHMMRMCCTSWHMHRWQMKLMVMCIKNQLKFDVSCLCYLCTIYITCAGPKTKADLRRALLSIGNLQNGDKDRVSFNDFIMATKLVLCVLF